MRPILTIQIFIFQVLLVTCLLSNSITRIGSRTIGRSETVDPNGRYSVGFEADHETSTITFDVSVQTRGYVGFGISPKGGMEGADIVIGGVYENGMAYFTDRHATGFREPIIDNEQNWQLLAASENVTHTSLKFSRAFDTCDDQDFPIGNDTSNIIWSFGETDTATYHGQNRGTYAVNLLDPPMPPVDVGQFEMWRLISNATMPTPRTSYYCTTHKSPPLSTKHHIVGFRPALSSAEALRHTHHFIIHSCKGPDGAPDDFFDKYVNGPGGDCYKGSTSVVPRQYCQSYLFVWAIGGKTVIYPDHVGYPLAEGGLTSHYMLEIHYDNPDEIQELKFETGAELFYTSKLRQYDAGTLTLGHRERFTLTVPPKVDNFIIAGHCGPTCSRNIPAGGINVFNVLLHSHLSGRKLKIRQFRNGKELPWLASDDNFNFNYQQNRPFHEEAKILPSDHLIYECSYDNSWKNGSTIGGFSTDEEMCNTFLWYYPRMNLEICQSEFPSNTLLSELGIQQIQWDPSDVLAQPIVLAPPSMANKTYTQVLDTIIPWTPANLERIQRELRFGEHTSRCVTRLQGEPEAEIRVTYPVIDEEYQPPDFCQERRLRN